MQVIKEYSGIKVTINEEDLNKKGVIYLLEFPNGKVYVGQTTRTIRDRINNHCGPYSYCSKLHNAILKYKKFNAYVISSGLSIEQLNVFEIFFINAYDANGNGGYNLDSGGKNKTISEETREKLKERSTGRKMTQEQIDLSVSKRQKAVKSIPDGIIFNSIKECEVYYGIAKQTLQHYQNGKIHQKSGQTFIKINKST